LRSTSKSNFSSSGGASKIGKGYISAGLNNGIVLSFLEVCPMLLANGRLY